jgi:hypothetical protein
MVCLEMHEYLGHHVFETILRLYRIMTIDFVKYFENVERYGNNIVESPTRRNIYA